MNVFLYLLVLFLYIGGQDAFSYEVTTHAAITKRAVENFVNAHPNKLGDLGVFSFVDTINTDIQFGSDWYDILPGIAEPRIRSAAPFELAIIKDLNAEVLGVDGWIMRGAIREDDAIFPFSANPQDDTINRPVNHFFDPVKNKALTLGNSNAKSPDWALGVLDAFTAEPAQRPNLNRINHYSLNEAKEAMFRATTLLAPGSNGWINVALGASSAERQAIRQAYWATAFKTLGDVAHLIQDAAQPQHTRNDPHSGLPFGGDVSFYERYVGAMSTSRLATSFDVGLVLKKPVSIATKALPLSVCDPSSGDCHTYSAASYRKCAIDSVGCRDHPTPTTPEYSALWSTTPGQVGGLGLADYSNQGFFSAGTNLGTNVYDFPANAKAAYVQVSVAPTHWDGSPVENGRPVQLYLATVQDRSNSSLSIEQVPLTSFSIWDEFLESRQFAPAFHLVRENYDAQAELLVPRAVAYSTALLERFFRGNMEISLPDEGVYGIVDHSTFTGTDAIQGFNGFSRVKLKLKNTTTAPAGSAPDAMGGGTLFAVLKFRRNTCYLDDLTGQQGAPAYRGPQCLTSVEETVVSNPSPSAVVGSNARQFTFDFNPALPINATSIYLQVVYRGQLGNEPDAVVVSTKDISEPTYITVENDSDYFRFNRPSDQSLTPKVFTRQQVNNDINLLNQVYPASCVVLESNTPPRLADNCFNGFNLQVGVSFNSLSMQSVLPPTRYLRVAVLSDMDSFTVHLASSACQLPADVSYPAVRMQSVLGTTYTSSFVALRNVFGWEIESCVASGDNQYPDPQADDRIQVMGALPEGSRLPYPVSISF